MKNDLRSRAKQQLDRCKAEDRMPTLEELVVLQQYAIKEFSHRTEALLVDFVK